MKSYHNKKIYNFKKVHKRKKRTKSTMTRNDKLGSEYTRIKQREFKTKCREILRLQKKGIIHEFPVHKKTMSWDW